MVHTSTQSQPAPALLIVALGVLLVLFGALGTTPLLVLGVPVVLGGLFALALSALTVTVTPTDVELAFRFGWPRRRIPLADVLRASSVRNKWWYGWGVRWIPGGGLWNVWGLDAVELSLAGGRRFRIGTDGPAAVVEAIASAQGGTTGVDGCWGV